ncbi:MAG: hypothetical protein D6711_17610 [Chloroflexi bacterium]|nr:MAG: hypothetical protein D6711_17610 [Chloroflexota bacterium]
MDVKTTLTKTKAGRRFMGFMRAVNQGDERVLRTTVTQYITEEALQLHDAETWVKQLMHIHQTTGGLKAIQVLASDEYRVLVMMQAKSDHRLHIVDMAVSEEYPHQVSQFIQRMA